MVVLALGKGNHRTVGPEHAPLAREAVPIRARADARGEKALELAAPRRLAAAPSGFRTRQALPGGRGLRALGVLLDEHAVVLVRLVGILQAGVREPDFEERGRQLVRLRVVLHDLL